MDFQNKLRVRHSGHHAKCSVCVRHRLIIRRLGRGPARVSQMRQYKAHLARQYKDRQVYWSHRARSRTEATSGAPISHLSLICDGMDQAKHCYPKGEFLNAKEFSGWVRPRLQSTTIIAHGHAILVGLSPQNTSPCGSKTMELIAYMMTKQLDYIHWSNVFLHLEAGNCAKELKHQTGLRMLSTMVALHRLRGCEFNYLSSGHSHEDIDSHFSLASSYLDRYPEMQSISDFQKCLQQMLDNKSVRVHEPRREVVVFDSFHDWTFGENRICFRKLVFSKVMDYRVFAFLLPAAMCFLVLAQENTFRSLPSGPTLQRHWGSRSPSCLSTGTCRWLRSPVWFYICTCFTCAVCCNTSKLQTYHCRLFSMTCTQLWPDNPIATNRRIEPPGLDFQVLASKTCARAPFGCGVEDSELFGWSIVVHRTKSQR